VPAPHSDRARAPGIPQGLTVVIAGFLPIIAIVSMFPAVPAIIDHFAKTDPRALVKVPAMVSAPGLTIALVALFAGWLVDRFGRRRLLLVATAAYGFIGSLPFFLDNIDAIYASRLLLGVSEAVILTVLNTLIGDYWDERGRRLWLTIQGAAGTVLGAAVILTSGYLTAVRWNGIFLIYTVGFPVFLAALAFLYEPERDTTARAMLGLDETATGFPWRAVVTFGGVTLLGSALYYVFIINGGLVWREVGIADSASIGRLTTIPSMFIVVGSVVFWLTGRFGPRVQLAMFFGLLGSGLMVMGAIHDWRGMVAGMALQQTGAGMAVPCLIAWAQTLLPYEHRGRGMGVWTACFFFGQFSSPLLVSVAHALLGTMQHAFAAAGLMGVVVAVLIFAFLPRPRAAAHPVGA